MSPIDEWDYENLSRAIVELRQGPRPITEIPVRKAAGRSEGFGKLCESYRESRMEEICERIGFSPEGIVKQALMSLHYGILTIRSLATQDPKAASWLADGMHNLPVALVKNDEAQILSLTAESVFVQ